MGINRTTTEKIQCYVSKETKRRLVRLVDTVPRSSQSSHVELALDSYMTLVEHRYGLHDGKGRK